ncbi:MAG: PAS domain S-box protein, partial [Armatimonadota bacterium]
VEGIARDVTERKRMEAERARLALAVESAADAIVITDADANIQYVNPAFERMTGYSLEEVRGKTPRILKSGKHGPEFYKDMWDTIIRGEVWTGRITNRRKDGSLYLERCTISSVRDQSGNVLNYVAVKRDITERVALEEKLRQSQKMEAVGRLAGGVAHDFNNLLTAISGYSDLLARKMDPDDPLCGYVREIRKAADRASSLTNQLLAFSRRQVMQPKIINLNTTVADMAQMLRRLIGEHIELKTVFGENLWCVKADPSHMEQVVMNLVVNARDAMPDGGRLIIETANVYLDKEYAQHHQPVQPGRYVMLAISDTGCGMDAETLAHAFEPFYTTKEKGKGTGLGLATVYGIVKQSGGYIWVYSEPGKGTTFRVYLPAVDGEPNVPEEVSYRSPDLAGDETVLLVEDEDAVRSLLKGVLASYGYTVLDASNGSEALDVAAKYQGPIHVVVTDVVMPEMGGRALTEKLVQQRPDVKVVFMSGYTGDAIAHHGVLDEGVEFLQKPFPLEAVAAKIRSVMSGQGG